MATLEERLAGCREDLFEAGKSKPKPFVIFDADYINVICQIGLGVIPKKTIVYAADIYALEVLNYLKKNKIRVPEQVEIVGFDHIDMLKYVNPKLCRVCYPVSEIGVTALNCLHEQINGSHNKHLNVLLLHHQVVEGESL